MTTPVPARPTPKPTDELLAERATTHGDFAVHARVTQLIKEALVSTGDSGKLSHVQREALDMIAHKMGRIVAGDPDHVDHWDDIAGYARLVSQRL